MLISKKHITFAKELIKNINKHINCGKVYSLRAQENRKKRKTKKVMKEIEKYSDITDDDCVFYSGKMLKDIYSRHNSFHQLSFESIKDNMRDKQIYHPYSDFDDDKMYKCFEYSRVSGAGIEYNTIAIMNY